MLLGMAIIFFAMTTSRYYASIWVLLFTWAALDKKEILNLVLSSWMFLGITVYLYYLPPGKMLCRKCFDLYNIWMLIYFLIVILFFLVRDLRWLHGRWRQRRSRLRTNPDKA